MTLDQLNSAAQTGLSSKGVAGKNENAKATTKKISDTSFRRPPNMPKDHRRGRRASPRRRFSRMQPIEMMYEKISAALETESTALNAASEPKLMAEITTETPRQTSS
jgi:hypothetical protein